MATFTDVIVKTGNPEALDATVQALPGVAAAVVDGTWNGESCHVRVQGDTT
jgi:hypothetical protein